LFTKYKLKLKDFSCSSNSQISVGVAVEDSVDEITVYYMGRVVR